MRQVPIVRCVRGDVVRPPSDRSPFDRFHFNRFPFDNPGQASRKEGL